MVADRIDLRTLATIASFVAVTGCLASKYPPAIPAESRIGEPTALTVAVQLAYGSEELAANLRKTGLFKEVWVETGDRVADLVVEHRELKRPEPGDWCYESLAYVGFTVFVIPGCWTSYGYELSIRPNGREPMTFDFDYDFTALAGWIAPLLWPLPDWHPPGRDEHDREAEHLAHQLRPWLDALGSGTEPSP